MLFHFVLNICKMLIAFGKSKYILKWLWSLFSRKLKMKKA